MIDSLETPCVLIDIEKVEANLRRAQHYADAHGLKLRPHMKTHKIVRFARRQVELGAVGITCQKIGEAEVMADGGLEDIFLPYNIVGETKLARLRALSERVKLSVTADHPAVVEGLSRAFADARTPLRVLVECDTGMGRCGVQSSTQAVTLAREIDAARGLSFGGLMTYPATGQVERNAAWLSQAAEALTSANLRAAIVSNGGTPDLWRAHEVAAATEHRPGTYIYSDRYQAGKGVGALSDCALTVLTTVVSRPTSTRAVIDAGTKTLTSDTLGLEDFGHVVGREDARIRSLSEEHGVIEFVDQPPAVGARLRIIPNHACPVSNLFDVVTLVRGDEIVESIRVDARGRVD